MNRSHIFDFEINLNKLRRDYIPISIKAQNLQQKILHSADCQPQTYRGIGHTILSNVNLACKTFFVFHYRIKHIRYDHF